MHSVINHINNMNSAIAAIEALADVNGEVTRIRVENLGG